MDARSVLVRLHRWVGLSIALFLVVAGLTGSVLVFRDEIDAWLNPGLFASPGSGAVLQPSALKRAVEAADPRVAVAAMPLTSAAGTAARMFVLPRRDEATGKSHALGFNEIFVDPVDGTLLGRRDIAGCCDRATVIPFLYRLHFSLHLPGRWGVWLLGLISILWLADCFVGAWLTLPRQAPFWPKWRPAWMIKRGAGSYRRHLDLHRAGGLWLWGVLAILAVTSIALNLRREVYFPIVALFSEVTPTPFDGPRQRTPGVPLPLDEIAARARAVAEARGWPAPGPMFHSMATGVMMIRFVGRDGEQPLGAPRLYVDDVDGRELMAIEPGQGTLGDLALALPLPLHSGRIAGLPGRILISVAGFVIAMLGITGMVIWWKKRGPRRGGGGGGPETVIRAVAVTDQGAWRDRCRRASMLQGPGPAAAT